MENEKAKTVAKALNRVHYRRVASSVEMEREVAALVASGCDELRALIIVVGEYEPIAQGGLA